MPQSLLEDRRRSGPADGRDRPRTGHRDGPRAGAGLVHGAIPVLEAGCHRSGLATSPAAIRRFLTPLDEAAMA